MVKILKTPSLSSSLNVKSLRLLSEMTWQSVTDLFDVWFHHMVVKHWNRLPRGAVAAPSLEVFKARLDGALSNLL